MQAYVKINNGQSVKIADIPVIPYKNFFFEVNHLLDNKHNHCVNYYGVEGEDKIQFFCIIANDAERMLYVLSHEMPSVGRKQLESITAHRYALHVFERDIHEKLGVEFLHHPWLKPLRYPYSRANKLSVMDNYPFYRINSEELHEVGVGPVHAGIIEPGHFKFICNGEKVLHLEIQLGYQHRGIEELYVKKNRVLQQCILSENIAGDTVVGHTMAYAAIIESLANINTENKLERERIIALELERIAMHIADTSALCTDVAYQFGQVVNEALRTLIINTSQLWCGNRFGKGLIRPGGTNYPLKAELAARMLSTIEDTEKRFLQITDRIYTLASILDRFEGVGTVTLKQSELIGAVGMAARHTNLKRDIRWSHPFSYYKQLNYEPALLPQGDVWARGMLRMIEAKKSFNIVKKLLKDIIAEGEQATYNVPQYNVSLMPSGFSVSLTEGWRGEICHAALTNSKGEICDYRVKDPSVHNWMALALAVRDQEISDFPVCNKSFNLSYCGHDL